MSEIPIFIHSFLLSSDYVIRIILVLGMTQWTRQRFGSHEVCGRLTYKLMSTFQKLVKVVQSCLTLCDPMGYTVHGILQGRILEWVAFPFSRGSSQPRDRTQVSCIAGRFFISWATVKPWSTRVGRLSLLQGIFPGFTCGCVAGRFCTHWALREVQEMQGRQ